jgi:predicted nucleic acid-binding protein
LVVDASVAVEFLLRTAIGQRLEPLLTQNRVFSPELLDVEILSVLRREARLGRVAADRAQDALEDLAAWDVERVPHRDLLEDAWALRHNVSAYDAFYVATARRHAATLLTLDGSLSRAGQLGVPIQIARAL